MTEQGENGIVQAKGDTMKRPTGLKYRTKLDAIPANIIAVMRTMRAGGRTFQAIRDTLKDRHRTTLSVSAIYGLCHDVAAPGKPIEQVRAAVIGGMTRKQAAAQFGVSVTSTQRWCIGIKTEEK